MTTTAKLVIIGAGIVGSSAAYHLAKLGWKEILLLDKGDLIENDGSTSHAPGGVVGVSHSKLLTQMAQYGSDLYRSLTPYSPDRNTYNAVGGMDLAISQTRWQDLKRLAGEAKSFHAEAHLLTPSEAKHKLPFLNEKAIVGAIFVPKGAIVAGSHVNGALQRDAVAKGSVRCVGNTQVTDIEVKNGRVSAVITNNPELPRIECESVLLCTNIWGPILGDKLGVPVPLMAYEHQYLITPPLSALAHFDRNKKQDEIIYPTVREVDSTIYFRQHWDSYGIGSYQHAPRPISPYAIGKTAMNLFTPEDFFGKPWQQSQNLLPMLSEAQPDRFLKQFNGMFAFSVDGMPIMGESKIKGLWTALASWLTHAGGVGKSIAEWMTAGETEWDMRQAHLYRFRPFESSRKYINLVCDKNYAEVYEIVHPRQPLSKPRNVRLSPFHSRLEALQSVFTTFAGLELPNWFESNARLLEKYEDRIPDRTGWAAQHWSRIQGAEHIETRENVALFDLTGLSLIEVRGAGACQFVNYLCSSQMDKPVGSVVYTTWLTPSGGVRRDLAVARLADDQFWMFVGEGSKPQDLVWVSRLAEGKRAEFGEIAINDISDSFTALGLWGPNARKVLSKVTDADVSNESFPYFTCQWIHIGYTRVLALRISYAGELGWELHIPMDAALNVWDELWEAGRDVEMIAAGMGAFDSLRLEKGYRLWGGDVYTEYNAYESGMGWTVRLDKDDFVGRDASIKLKGQPLNKKLCALTLNDRKAVAMGYEPILDNGHCVGMVTSANYGYSIGKFILYGYLPLAYSKPGTQLDIEYFGERFAATVTNEPLWDAKMTRLKG